MSHLTPRDPEELGSLGPMLDVVKSAMGFVPNSVLTMAHLPQLPIAFLMLASTVFGGDLRPQLEQMRQIVPEPGDGEPLDGALIQLVAFAASLAAGCRYCQAHTAHAAAHRGVDEVKVADILRYESSPHFNEAERAALALAFAAGKTPNESDAENFAALRRHYSEPQIVRLVAVIALFGFLNRWNDTLATALEAEPLAFASAHLADVAWQPGKHGAACQQG